LILLSLFVL
jgi:hypothetical protein